MTPSLEELRAFEGVPTSKRPPLLKPRGGLLPKLAKSGGSYSRALDLLRAFLGQTMRNRTKQQNTHAGVAFAKLKAACNTHYEDVSLQARTAL